MIKHLHKYKRLPGTNILACYFRGCGKAKSAPQITKEKKPRRLRREGKSTISEVKRRIQGHLREICLLRDKECVLANVPGFTCSGYRNDGGLIYQADHLITRARPHLYHDPLNVVLICRGHHGGWKKNNPNEYDRIVRGIVGEERWQYLQEKNKHSPPPYSEREWLRAEKELVDVVEMLRTNKKPMIANE